MTAPRRAELWAVFAAAAMSKQAGTERSANEADRMLAEFDERFEWDGGEYSNGPRWAERRKPASGK